MLCGLSKWQGRRIPLELHHLNGDRTNNTLENIMIICPNCHKLEHEN
jgi:predicted HNH restriction endonuclease